MLRLRMPAAVAAHREDAGLSFGPSPEVIR
jgi:hypothetical protein